MSLSDNCDTVETASIGTKKGQGNHEKPTLRKLASDHPVWSTMREMELKGFLRHLAKESGYKNSKRFLINFQDFFFFAEFMS